MSGSSASGPVTTYEAPISAMYRQSRQGSAGRKGGGGSSPGEKRKRSRLAEDEDIVRISGGSDEFEKLYTLLLRDALEKAAVLQDRVAARIRHCDSGEQNDQNDVPPSPAPVDSRVHLTGPAQTVEEEEGDDRDEESDPLGRRPEDDGGEVQPREHLEGARFRPERPRIAERRQPGGREKESLSHAIGVAIFPQVRKGPSIVHQVAAD